jgi:hypothetical protein
MSPFLTLPPFRAGAAVSPSRIIKQSAAFTAIQATAKSDKPLGITRQWSKFPPIVDYSLSADHATAAGDPIAFAGPLNVELVEVGSGGLTAGDDVTSDSVGKGITFSGTGWSVGIALEAAPAGSFCPVWVFPRYITNAALAGIAFTGLKTLPAAGVAAAGPITLTGAVVGERVLMVIGAPTAGGTLVAPESSFESVITVADQIQQTQAANLSANTYVFVLAPAFVG